MADRGHVLTDKRLRDIERRMAEEYEQATEEMREKLIRFLNQFQAQDNIQRNLLKAGKITAKDYADWRYRHIMMNKRWAEMSATLAADYHNVNQIVAGIYRGERGDIYALNHNFAVYQMEHDGLMDTGLTLYDRDSVNRILRDNPQMLPPPGKKASERIAAGVDVRWNNQQIQSVMLQGILQGDTIPELARRLEQVTERNYTAAVRNARTMATGAQNAGRLEAYKRATNLGVDLVEEWQATLDMRTRHDHRLMHGKRINVGEKWKTPQGELKFPGDPEGPPGEVYNCRCTTLSYVKGFEKDAIKSSPKMGDLSFEEWQVEKAHPDTQADREQYAEYRKLLGKNAPASYYAFREVKYTKPDAWAEMKTQAQTKRIEKKVKDEKAALKVGEENRTYHNESGMWPQTGTPITKEQLESLKKHAESRGIRIYDFKGYDGDYDLAVEFIDSVADIADEYPMLRGYRKPVQIRCSHNLNDGTYADTRGHVITINSYAFRDREMLARSYKALADAGFFVKGTDYRSIAVHESAHAIINAYQRGTRRLISRVFPGFQKEEIADTVASEVSRYATKDRHELVAEAFSAYKHGNRSDLVLKVLQSCGIV